MAFGISEIICTFATLMDNANIQNKMERFFEILQRVLKFIAICLAKVIYYAVTYTAKVCVAIGKYSVKAYNAARKQLTKFIAEQREKSASKSGDWTQRSKLWTPQKKEITEEPKQEPKIATGPMSWVNQQAEVIVNDTPKHVAETPIAEESVHVEEPVAVKVVTPVVEKVEEHTIDPIAAHVVKPAAESVNAWQPTPVTEEPAVVLNEPEKNDEDIVMELPVEDVQEGDEQLVPEQHEATIDVLPEKKEDDFFDVPITRQEESVPENDPFAPVEEVKPTDEISFVVESPESEEKENPVEASDEPNDIFDNSGKISFGDFMSFEPEEQTEVAESLPPTPPEGKGESLPQNLTTSKPQNEELRSEEGLQLTGYGLQENPQPTTDNPKPQNEEPDFMQGIVMGDEEETTPIVEEEPKSEPKVEAPKPQEDEEGDRYIEGDLFRF